MLSGDVLDKTSIENAMEGCDTVFHCAYGNTNDIRLDKRINEEGTKNICELALKKRIKKLVYISSVAVYGSDPPSLVNEETPTSFSDDEYGNSKIRAEEICFHFFARKLPVIIIRPTIVFGPFSPIWTIGTIKRVLLGGWQNVQGMNGLCNPVYIDDLVKSLFLTINSDEAIGEVFIISGENPITWNQYFLEYIQLTDSPSPKTISQKRRRLNFMFSSLLRTNISFLRKFFEPQIQDIYHYIKERKPYFTCKIEHLIRGGIKDNEVKMFSQKNTFSIRKAQEVLGYTPISFKDGMTITSEWLKHHRYI
jgi:nucleoside-diphosphate-sugar epimerase